MAEYLFIDESGDPGYILLDRASSKHYAELALQLNGDSLSDVIAHIINWKYVLGKLYETKDLPKGEQCKRYLAPILELHRQGKLKCSCVHLFKDCYTGPYLKPELPTGHEPLYFRNFIHKELLEHHFTQFPITHKVGINLIFDDYRMPFEEVRNIEDYLQNNWNLPTFKRIIHDDSIPNLALQITSQLVRIVNGIVLGTIDKERKELLSFIALKDITRI